MINGNNYVLGSSLGVSENTCGGFVGRCMCANPGSRSVRSVAIFGASNRIDSVCQFVLQNMLQSGFQGKLYPINPKSPEVQGQRAYADIGEIGEPVELVVIATPPTIFHKVI